jgi:hypothetical protein
VRADATIDLSVADAQVAHLRFFAEHSAWTVFLPLFLILGVGWVLRHYG